MSSSRSTTKDIRSKRSSQWGLRSVPKTTTISSTTTPRTSQLWTLNTTNDQSHFFCFLFPLKLPIFGALGLFLVSFFLFIILDIFFFFSEVTGLFSLLLCLFFLFYQVLFCISKSTDTYSLWWFIASELIRFWSFPCAYHSWTSRPDSPKVFALGLQGHWFLQGLYWHSRVFACRSALLFEPPQAPPLWSLSLFCNLKQTLADHWC